MTGTPQPPHIQRLVQFFERMTPDSLDRLHEAYVEGCRFKDPFNEVTGLRAVRGVYAHMYKQLDQPRFRVKQAIVQGDHCVLTWDFLFGLRSRPGVVQTVRGATHLLLDGDGRIIDHRDYWDVAEELYEKLPVLGGLMRWLRRKMAA